MLKLSMCLVLTLPLCLGVIAQTAPAGAAAASGQVYVRHIQEADRPIATGVWVGDTLYLSGQLASPVTPADAAKGTAAVYGDTEAQTMSTLTKIQAALKSEGLGMGDVVMMHVYMAGDPAKGGKLDFPGMMAAYTRFFGTKEQPNKPARSAMQVAALAAPWALVEIEVIAVKATEKAAQ
jgi:enamine deaminase RidA (YjgF/YER057c/UK114 family)